jgi:hypothetical protein
VLELQGLEVPAFYLGVLRPGSGRRRGVMIDSGEDRCSLIFVIGFMGRIGAKGQRPRVPGTKSVPKGLNILDG